MASHLCLLRTKQMRIFTWVLLLLLLCGIAEPVWFAPHEFRNHPRVQRAMAATGASSPETALHSVRRGAARCEKGINPQTIAAVARENYKLVAKRKAQGGASVIPRLLHQTARDRASVPPKVARNMRQFAGTFQRRVWIDEEIHDFLVQHFPGTGYATTFHTLRYGAHKADLFRYAVLYVLGGIYVDIDIPLVRPLEEVVDLSRNAIYTSLAKQPGCIFQAVIAAPPRQPLFLHLMDFMKSNVARNGPPSNGKGYHIFTRDMYRQVRADIAGAPGDTLAPGEHASKCDPSLTYVLMQEACHRNASQCPTKLDRYHLCCSVRLRGEVQFMSRYSDYPWK